ncbi:S24 family peptidase [Xanthobacter autotrophicus]|uniref:S24 family peptidase n=1 Tax=Xanthobacter autotrophicus TaxID=280 RepID=UPI00372C58EB
MTILQMLSAIMAAKRWNKTELAGALDVSQPTVTRWFRDGQDPRGETRDKIRTLYASVMEEDVHIDSMEVAESAGRRLVRKLDQEVRVVGYIGAGAEVHTVDDHEKGAGLDLVQVDFPVKHGTVGVIVRGDSMLPMFEDGDLIGYIRDASGPEQLIGKICVVKVVDGATYIKRLKRGTEPGLYTLVSANARDIEDVEIEWAARYRFHLPADEWHRLKGFV